mgnify:CR=1 FL=1
MGAVTDARPDMLLDAAQRVLDVYAGKDAEPYQTKLHEAMQALNDAAEWHRAID